MAFKLNNSDQMETLAVFKIKVFPLVWQAKAEELVEQGLFKTIEEAKKECGDWEIQLEVYYEKGYGAFAVESEVVECGTIYSPYSAELGNKADE